MIRTAHSLTILLLLCVPALAETLAGRVVGITDGDTITLLDAGNTQHKVRLNGIDCPESGQDFGGKVTLDGQDINLAMIEAGFAWYFRRYERDEKRGEMSR